MRVAGGVDDAEDADVILHEYGHALLEASAPGLLLNGGEGRAIHEGWSDYWAASYRRYLHQEGYVPGGDWRRLFVWDSGWTCDCTTYWSGRVVKN
jgi:zinc metalloprotease ZmpB